MSEDLTSISTANNTIIRLSTQKYTKILYRRRLNSESRDCYHYNVQTRFSLSPLVTRIIAAAFEHVLNLLLKINYEVLLSLIAHSILKIK